jgi:hypothetical protein
MVSLLHVRAEKVAVFEEFGRPEGINIDDGYIYINERITVFIYNLKNYKFVNKFGKEGEGPGEIKRNPYGGPMLVESHNGKVYISSMGKLSIFSKTGKYEKEYKVNATDSYYPFGERYVCLSTAPKEETGGEPVLALFLAEKNLKKGKLIYKSDLEIGPNFKWGFPITPFYFESDGDKLFVIAGIHGFAIDAFDQNGKKLYRIKRDYERIKIPSFYKDKTLKWFEMDPNYKQLYEFVKTRISIKDYYPPIYGMIVDNGRIYVMTNKLKNGQRECIVMDLKGNEKKRVFLPIPELYGMDFNFLCTIKNNYLYKLEENIDDETWELYKIEI